MSIKYGEMISKYDGTGDFSQWVEKLELVASLTDVQKLEKFLPLFLDGTAFNCYQNLPSEVKDNYSSLKKAFLTKFSLDSSLAYEEVIRRRLLAGESVENYLAEITRLARLADSDVSDKMIKNMFLAGLPPDVKEKIRSANDVNSMTLQSLIDRAKSIVKSAEICSAAINSDTACHTFSVAHKVENSNLKTEFLSKSKEINKRENSQTCFICRATGHMARQCPNKYCLVCGSKSHNAPSCPNRASAPKNE